MIEPSEFSVERGWARLGVLFPCTPSRSTPDVERLLLATATRLSSNARLFPLVATWLASYDCFVARHRLKRLATAELATSDSPALGLLLETAIEFGTSRDLAVAAEACKPAALPRPLFAVHRASDQLAAAAESAASPLSRRWGVWSPPVALKPGAIRPVSWILARNPGLKDRAVRKGDLRCSILETLRRDAGGWVRSESELTRLSGATRTAVRKALRALELEGEVVVRASAENARDHAVEPRAA